MVISHEAIYKSLFVRSRGVLDHQLTKRLRTRRPTRRNVHNTTTGQWRSQIKNAVSIHDRPAHVETREEVGHWEGDMLLGRHWTQIATLVERTSGYTICLELASRHTSVVVDAIINRIGNAPDGLFKSPITSGSPRRPASRSSSAIPGHPGSVARTRTRTVCCASTCRRVSRWPA